MFSRPDRFFRDNQSKAMRFKSASPVKRRSSFSQSGTENMSLSPRVTHKGIEVLHNLQRSPSISPNRSRRESPEKPVEKTSTSVMGENTAPIPDDSGTNTTNAMMPDLNVATQTDNPTATKAFKTDDRKATWESLGLVDSECLRNLKSGVG